jgi:hypothetical protein
MVKIRRKKITRVVADMSRVQLAVLGHSPAQLESLPHRDWLFPTYLDRLDLGFYNDYQENHWAEGRAFLCDSLFNYSKYDYVGVVSASWNNKFYSPRLEKIDRHENIHKLFDNNTVITSLLEPFWMWHTMFDYIGFTNGTKISDFVKSYFKGINTNKLVPLSNQVICHKSIFKGLCNFHKSVVEDIRKFVDKYGDVPENELTRSRKYAYVVEAMTMAYFQSKDYNYVPVAKLHPQWYNPRAAAKRYRDDNRQNK